MLDDRHKARLFLKTDPLRHLVQLKYLHLYADDVDCFYVECGESRGVLLSHPTQLISWNVTAYPFTKAVLLPAASDSAAAQRLLERALDQFSPDDSLVFKFCDAATKDVFGRAFRLQYVKTLVSYTADARREFPASDDIVISEQLDEACAALYIENGYNRTEILKFFAEGAVSFTIYDGKQPVCTCFVYRNFDSIWEIGGVHTVEQARKNGYGRQVVQAALNWLLARGYVPRYQVVAGNTPSVKLAESLSLLPCLNFEHYVHQSHL